MPSCWFAQKLPGTGGPTVGGGVVSGWPPGVVTGGGVGSVPEGQLGTMGSKMNI